MLFPRMERVSSLTGSRFFRVMVTLFMWVFMATSTPVMVPRTWVPFFSSRVTVSWESFIRNLHEMGINAITTLQDEPTLVLTEPSYLTSFMMPP